MNVKVKLALLWVALMFLYIYNDILFMFQPGHPWLKKNMKEGIAR